VSTPTTAAARAAKLPRTGDGQPSGNARLFWASAALSLAGAGVVGFAVRSRRRVR
jgi:hypothetical protein